MNYYDGYWGMNLLWWLFWIAIIAMFFFTPLKTSRSTRSSLLHTLRKTYAEGKISTEEYEERKKVLEKEFLVRNKKDKIE
ncbi:MAG: SHOCT domain-containing protein [Bacteroidota bacterium]|nr:SHOCT domain-containing protein [Bacteroidota bacterium]